MISNATICSPAISGISALESTPPATLDSTSTPSNNILADELSKIELSETLAAKATLSPVILVPLLSAIAVSAVA